MPALVLAQWLLLLLLVRHIEHNGWLFSGSGESRSFYSAAWSLAGGHLPRAVLGYGWSLVTMPIAGIAGSNFLDGLPALVLAQTLVLLPVSLLAVYGIASSVAGRALGSFTAACWVVVPYAAVPLFASSYHAIYEDQLLPQALGLTALSGFPSVVCLLVAAYFALTSIDTADPARAALAGLFAGLAIGIDPANALFLFAPAAGYALARRPREALVFGISLLPALLTLLLWKYRGLGNVPAIHLRVDFHHLQQVRLDFRNTFYSDRLVEVPFLAGLIAIGRRSWTKSAFVGAWFVPFLLVRLSEHDAGIATGTWFGLMMPAFPAFLIAVCSLPLLVPRLGPRLADLRIPPRPSRLNSLDRRIVAAAIVLALLPFVVLAALPLQERPVLVASPDDHALVPVLARFRPTATIGAGAASLAWKAQTPPGATVYYEVFRAQDAVAGGIACKRGSGAAKCTLTMPMVVATNFLSYGDSGLPPGRWTYRIGIAASRTGQPTGGELIAVSAPLELKVP